ncbi:MAG: hypothetical protein WCG14_01105 [Chlamydiia bacterium]
MAASTALPASTDSTALLVLSPVVASEGTKPLYINYTVGGRGYSRLANTAETEKIKVVFDKAISSLRSKEGDSGKWTVDNVSFNSHTITLINQNSETQLFSAGSHEAHRDVYSRLLEGLAAVTSGNEESQTFSGINPPADYGQWMNVKRQQGRSSTPIGSSFGVVGDLFRRGRAGLTMENLGVIQDQPGVDSLQTSRETDFTAFLAKTEPPAGNLKNRNESLKLATAFETAELEALKTARGLLTWQDKKPTDDQLKLEAASRAGQFLLWLSATNEGLNSGIEDRIDFYANRKEPITGLDVLTALDAAIGNIPSPLEETPELEGVRDSPQAAPQGEEAPVVASSRVSLGSASSDEDSVEEDGSSGRGSLSGDLGRRSSLSSGGSEDSFSEGG